jgi:dUTP pyrophosphatase
LIEDRSGLATRGITTVAGVVDSGYRGEMLVVIANVSKEAFTIQEGDRIAQLRIVRRHEAIFEVVDELSKSGRDTEALAAPANESKVILKFPILYLS